MIPACGHPRRWACAAARDDDVGELLAVPPAPTQRARAGFPRSARGGDGDGHALERKSKQRRTAAPSPSAGPSCSGADLISCLGDDVLVRVLEMLPDERDAVRTDVLSRRWRGLWTRLPALRFASSIRPEFWSVGDGSQRYVAFVNDAVALRAAQTAPALQRLAISFTMASTRFLYRCFEAAQGWIRDAARNEVKSFVLELHLPIAFYDYHDGGNNKKAQFVVALDDLPSSAKMETMRLALDGATVRLPAAATFASLVDLSLDNLEFADGGGHLLNRLLSPASCPRLRNLSMRKVRFAGLDELLLEAAEVLTELTWEGTGCRPNTVRLRTPALCVLRMVDCDLDELTLSAPRLEELLFFAGLPISTLDVDGVVER